MALDIFSFQRAFTARQKMALAACDCNNSLAQAEAKDIADALYLGLNCSKADCGEFGDPNSAIDEFIIDCHAILKKLSSTEESYVTIMLSNNVLNLSEKDGKLQLHMDNKQVTVPNLTLTHLYSNLLQDIEDNPDLYGNDLFSYGHDLKRGKTNSHVLLTII